MATRTALDDPLPTVCVHVEVLGVDVIDEFGPCVKASNATAMRQYPAASAATQIHFAAVES